ncbi:MAG TPA: prepilin-type N-terminal cleavage/methylation domain-containing protein [Pantanalinema sp.]
MVRNTSKQAGFTLIELLVVVVIIGILASVAIPNFMGAQDKAKNSGVQANVHNVQTALEQYAIDNSGSYPDKLSAMIGGAGYLTTYPKTPWGKQQAPGSDINADYSGNVALGSGAATSYKAPGVLADPTLMDHFGAIGYYRSGAANEKYDLVGAGKKAQDSVCVIHVKNY